MARITRKDRKMIWATSLALGLALVLTAIVNEILLRATLILRTDQLIIIAVIIALFPPGMAEYVDTRWRNSVDKNIPEFLREVSEAGRTGVTLNRAVDLASQRRYGPLSEELRRVAVKVSWGGDLEEALRDFGNRVDTRLAKRTAILLSEVSRSGGNIEEVLQIISKHAGELQTIESERRSQLRMYVAIIYVAFLVFLFIDYLLIKVFFAGIESLKDTLGESGGLFTIGDITVIQVLMYHMCIVEGFFGGLVAGKMGEGTVGSGLKHAVILMSVGFIAFSMFM